MVALGSRTEQRQIHSRRELAAVLVALGLPSDEARRHAEALFSKRPGDAALESARPRQELWRATGLPAWAILAILAGIVLLYVLARIYFHRH